MSAGKGENVMGTNLDCASAIANAMLPERARAERDDLFIGVAEFFPLDPPIR